MNLIFDLDADIILHIFKAQSTVGMAIPRRILLLEESRNQGMAICHSSRIEEGKIYSSGNGGISRNENLFLVQYNLVLLL